METRRSSPFKPCSWAPPASTHLYLLCCPLMSSTCAYPELLSNGDQRCFQESRFSCCCRTARLRNADPLPGAGGAGHRCRGAPGKSFAPTDHVKVAANVQTCPTWVFAASSCEAQSFIGPFELDPITRMSLERTGLPSSRERQWGH